MTDAHRLVVRKVEPQPTYDLFWAPRRGPPSALPASGPTALPRHARPRNHRPVRRTDLNAAARFTPARLEDTRLSYASAFPSRSSRFTAVLLPSPNTEGEHSAHVRLGRDGADPTTPVRRRHGEPLHAVQPDRAFRRIEIRERAGAGSSPTPIFLEASTFGDYVACKPEQTSVASCPPFGGVVRVLAMHNGKSHSYSVKHRGSCF